MIVPPLVLALLDALEEPALLVSGERTVAANRAARALLGPGLIGQDVRFAIRQPQALDAILKGRRGRVEVLGIGGVDRSFEVVLTILQPELLLVRLVDRSARQAAEKAQVDFVANASHELRTPLAAVLGFSETLADEAPLPEALRRRFGEQIHAQAKRMMVIIRDLMSLSRIEADRFSAPRTTVVLGELIREAVVAAGALAEERSCTIEVSLAEDAAPVLGDLPQLRQLLDNLLGNAIRYGCRGDGGRVSVSLSGGGPGWQRLVVRDNGGTGLGLAIVAQIVERHRGLLQISSRPGEGVEVEVRLPSA
jgi:two-component system phosphate regulon sensor histidine kinase PhoR